MRMNRTFLVFPILRSTSQFARFRDFGIRISAERDFGIRISAEPRRDYMNECRLCFVVHVSDLMLFFLFSFCSFEVGYPYYTSWNFDSCKCFTYFGVNYNHLCNVRLVYSYSNHDMVVLN